MIGMSVRFSAMCVLGLSLAACAGAEEPKIGGPTPEGGLDLGDIARDDAAAGADDAEKPVVAHETPRELSDDGGSNDDGADDTEGDDSEGNDDPPVSDGDPSCACDLPLPGIDIHQGGGKIEISIDLPGQPVVVIDVLGGDCETTESGLHVKGDLTLKVGAGQALALFGADLRAKVSSLSQLSLDVDAGLLSALDASALPLAAQEIDLVDVHAHLATDACQCHDQLEITGSWVSVPPRGCRCCR